MTAKEAIENLKAILEEATETEDAVSYVTSVDAESLNLAIEALKKQIEHSQNTPQKQPDLETFGVKTGKTCADAISRQAAIDAIKTSRYLVDAMEKIIRLPSAQPKTGQWLENETTFSETGRQTATCSVCGLRSPRPLGDFCRWCGAHMTEGDDCCEKYLKNRAERRTDA